MIVMGKEIEVIVTGWEEIGEEKKKFLWDFESNQIGEDWGKRESVLIEANINEKGHVDH